MDYRRRHGLSPQDAIVYASVVSDLASGTGRGCFLNRNTKDFDDPDIAQELWALGCKLLPRFDQGLDYMRAQGANGIAQAHPNENDPGFDYAGE